MIVSGHFADTQCLTCCEPNLTGNRPVVAWADTQNSYGMQPGYGPISPIPPWRKTRNFTEEAHAHNYRNLLAEQHVYWQEQGRHALNFQQANFERAAQECEQTDRHEVHVAVAQATEMSRAAMRERMGVLENEAKQNLRSHQATLLNEMDSVADDALENQRRSLLNEATAELRRHQRPSHKHLQEHQQSVRRHLSDFQQEVQVQKVASSEELEILRHELSQSLAEGSHYQNLCTTSRSGASEGSSEFLRLRQERDHLNVHGRNLETETPAFQRSVRSLEAQVAQIHQWRGMTEVEGQTSNTPQAEVLRRGAANLQFSQGLDRSKKHFSSRARQLEKPAPAAAAVKGDKRKGK